MDLTAAGKSDVLARATECELSGPADAFMLACEWTADSYGAALSRFNFLRVTLDTCVETEFEARDNTYDKDGYRVLHRFWGTAGEDDEDYDSVDINLELVEYTREDTGTRYWVNLEFSR